MSLVTCRYVSLLETLRHHLVQFSSVCSMVLRGKPRTAWTHQPQNLMRPWVKFHANTSSVSEKFMLAERLMWTAVSSWWPCFCVLFQGHSLQFSAVNNCW